MKIELGNIASIQTGLFSKTVSDGEIVYLQVKHFDENGILQKALHPDLKEDTVTDRHLLWDKDILFAAKGTKNFAALYEQSDFPCVASTTFFVIRLSDRKVLPEYLVWFMNQPHTQKILKSGAIGSSIVSISKSVLEKIEVPIPSIQIQKNILKIVALRNKEKCIKSRIEQLRTQQIQHQINQLIQN